MALAKTVTKSFPTLNHIGIHLRLTDDARPDLGQGEQVVIDTDFTEQFTPGSGMANAIRDAVGNAAQAAINEYKERLAIYNSAAFDTAVNQINNALEV